MKQFTARVYNDFLINQEGHIVKTSSVERLADEIRYYLAIANTPLKDLFPKVYSYDLSGPYSLELEYYPGGTISSPTSELNKILDRMSSICVSGSSIQRRKMYYDKTFYYQKELIANPFFKQLDAFKHLIINGKKYLNFSQIQSDLIIVIESLINDDPFTVIHGDLCFSNILSNYKLIDPRGSFGSNGIYGDPLYDVAKIRHSQHGRYEDIINDRFKLNVNRSFIDFDLLPANDLNIPLYNDHKVKLIEGLIFIGMCSRHYDSLQRQIVMYATGIKILNENLY